jgi:hypothetical protein
MAPGRESEARELIERLSQEHRPKGYEKLGVIIDNALEMQVQIFILHASVIYTPFADPKAVEFPTSCTIAQRISFWNFCRMRTTTSMRVQSRH